MPARHVGVTPVAYRAARAPRASCVFRSREIAAAFVASIGDATDSPGRESRRDATSHPERKTSP